MACTIGLLLTCQAHAQSFVEAHDPGVYAVSGAHGQPDPGTTSGQRSTGSTPALLRRTTHICAKLHTSFGARFILSADFDGDTLPVDVAIAHPAMADHGGASQDVDHIGSTLRAGEAHFFGWTFDDPAKLKAGRWHIILGHGGVVLADQPFDIDFTCGVPIS